MAKNDDNDQDDISWFPYILAVTSIVVIGIVVLSINQQNKPVTKAPVTKVETNKKATKTARNVSDVTVKVLTKAGSSPEKISFPYEIKDNVDDARMEYSFTLNHEQNSKITYHIIPDDCVEKFEVNGKTVDLEGEYQQNRCHWQKGFNIDLKPYLTAGANKVTIEVKNNKGPTSLTVNSGK
jgi:hypothetical protein